MTQVSVAHMASKLGGGVNIMVETDNGLVTGIKSPAGTSVLAPATGVPLALATGTVFDGTHNGANVVATSTPNYVLNNGQTSGWGCAVRGAFTYSGTATVNDVRTTGATNPWAAFMQTSADHYDLVGSKP